MIMMSSLHDASCVAFCFVYSWNNTVEMNMEDRFTKEYIDKAEKWMAETYLFLIFPQKVKFSREMLITLSNFTCNNSEMP